ncbi:MAG: hypothetical protein GEV03_00695 [Streptosporangiales bacterium]|nr:hypothetical protein [Streptosporangiales bacterium]
MDVFEALVEAAETGRPAVLVTVIGMESPAGGHIPSRPGAKLAVVDGTVAAGTLGCAEFDTAGVELAASLPEGETGTLRRRAVFRHGEEQVLELFAERYDPQPAVVVAGSNPVGRAVADLAERIGRRVRHLADDAADADPLAALRAQPPGPRDAVVLSDHDAPYVDEALPMLLAGEAYFVGMLGSRRHAGEVVDGLRKSGVPAEQLARLHSPCGLDIGSRGPEEIALSIVAEIVATERGRAGGRMGLNWAA